MPSFDAEGRAALVDSVQRLLREQSKESDVRRTMETERGYDPALWRQFAEIGMLGLLIDEELGGSGAGPVELELVMEQVGAALLCSPYLSSAVLATALLNACGDIAAKERLLPAMADGRSIATVAFTGRSGCWTQEGIGVFATPTLSGAWTLSGRASYVTHGQIADVLLAVARVDDGFGVFEVDPQGAGLKIRPLPAFDLTLRLAEMQFEQVTAHRIGNAEWDAVEAALDVTLVALAGEQAGAARRLLDMTVEYTKSRVQFGRPIAGFQAIKHMAADLLVEVESATSAARHAARALADQGVDADELVNLAAFTCADTFSQVAATSVQMHGGIAFTWEHPAHLYLRRARADAQLFGGSDFYRERYLSILETSNV